MIPENLPRLDLRLRFLTVRREFAAIGRELSAIGWKFAITDRELSVKGSIQSKAKLTLPFQQRSL